MIESLSEQEIEIVQKYLNEKISIRELSVEYGFGRTKINNILTKFANQNEENAQKMELKKASLKKHKNIETKEQIEIIELEDDEIEDAYKAIMERGETLTNVAQRKNVNRDRLKKLIVGFLDSEDAILEFKECLKENQTHRKIENEFNDTLEIEEKKNIIFNKLNTRRRLKNRTAYSRDMLEKKLSRLLQYFEKRNSRISEPEAKITENQLMKMLFDEPTLLTRNLTDRINPVVKKLDYKYLGVKNTTRVITENPAILISTLDRTRLQIRILKETDTLKYAIEKPRVFRTSPELLYSLIKLRNEHYKNTTPFISRKRLLESYGLIGDEIKEKYDIRKEYGDDEYFDGR